MSLGRFGGSQPERHGHEVAIMAEESTGAMQIEWRWDSNIIPRPGNEGEWGGVSGVG